MIVRPESTAGGGAPRLATYSARRRGSISTACASFICATSRAAFSVHSFSPRLASRSGWNCRMLRRYAALTSSFDALSATPNSSKCEMLPSRATSSSSRCRLGALGPPATAGAPDDDDDDDAAATAGMAPDDPAADTRSVVPPTAR